MGRLERAARFGYDAGWHEDTEWYVVTLGEWMQDQRNMRRPFNKSEQDHRQWLARVAENFEERGLEKAAWKARQAIAESFR